MMMLVDGTIMYTLKTRTAVNIPARLKKEGIELTEVCEVLNEMYAFLNRSGKEERTKTVQEFLAMNVKPIAARFCNVYNALSFIWKGYAAEYNKIAYDGLCLTARGSWDVLKSLKKKLRKGKQVSFNVGTARVTVESKDRILVMYGDNLEYVLPFIRDGNKFRADSSGDFAKHKGAQVWLNARTGYATYLKKGMFQDLLDMLQDALWSDDERPVHSQYALVPTAPIDSLMNLQLFGDDSHLGLDMLRTLCNIAKLYTKEAKYGNVER